MESLIAEQHGLKSTADEISEARFELRNAQALADKLQTLLDSKTHQVDALHKELENTRHANELIVAARDRWQALCADEKNTVDALMKILRPHAAPAYAELGTPLDVARNIVASLDASEPDIDTVPLQVLLEAVGTFLKHGQAVTIRGSYQAVTEVDIEAMGLTFRVGTHEASEALTHAQELAQCLLVEVGS